MDLYCTLNIELHFQKLTINTNKYKLDDGNEQLVVYDLMPNHNMVLDFISIPYDVFCIEIYSKLTDQVKSNIPTIHHKMSQETTDQNVSVYTYKTPPSRVGKNEIVIVPHNLLGTPWCCAEKCWSVNGEICFCRTHLYIGLMLDSVQLFYGTKDVFTSAKGSRLDSCCCAALSL